MDARIKSGHDEHWVTFGQIDPAAVRGSRLTLLPGAASGCGSAFVPAPRNNDKRGARRSRCRIRTPPKTTDHEMESEAATVRSRSRSTAELEIAAGSTSRSYCRRFATAVEPVARAGA